MGTRAVGKRAAADEAAPTPSPKPLFSLDHSHLPDNSPMDDAAMDEATNALPEDRRLVLRVMPMPADANIHGDVFGGWIMAQVDIAGSLPAVRRANGRIATVAVNSFVFRQPVFVGDLLSFYAEVVRVGRTSITVLVEVYAQRNRMDDAVVKVTEATLTYVATDDLRQPRELPPGPGSGPGPARQRPEATR